MERIESTKSWLVLGIQAELKKGNREVTQVAVKEFLDARAKVIRQRPPEARR